MKKIQLNLDNRFIYTFIVIVLILLIGVGVFAFGTSNPSSFGHSSGELNFSEGVEGDVIFNGNVGIGTSNPQAKLDVAGEVKIGNTGLVCNSSIGGSLRYNSIDKVFEFCDATDWQAFDSISSTNLAISSSVNNYNIYEMLGSPVDPVNVDLTINSGTIIGSTNTSQPALTTGNLPVGSTVTIVNNGRIQGKGGEGGDGGERDNHGKGGEIGGNAIEILVDVSIDNANGQIWSGGGGGGGGAAGPGNGGGGGGAAGDLPGIGGNPGTHSASTAQPGQDGTTTLGGNGGSGGCAYDGCGGDGAKGGNPGQDGETASGYSWTGYYGDSRSTDGGAGGAAGKAVSLNGNTINWILQGDVRGVIN